MQRIKLLGSPAAAESLEAWREKAYAATRAGDHMTLIALINRPGGRVNLRAGRSTGMSFADFCMHSDSLSSLRAVLDAAPDGVTFDDTCVNHMIARASRGKAQMEILTERALHETALELGHSEALALALEYAPEHSSVTDELHGFRGASLHYHALYRISMSGDPVLVAKMAECCRLLIKAKAPFSHSNQSHRTTLPGMLFGHRWNRSGLQDSMVPLIGEYFRAGAFNFNDVASDGRPPLELSIVSCNGYAAAAAIDLGCPIETPGYPEFNGNLLGLVDSFAPLDNLGTCKPLVAEALMRRQIHADTYVNPAAGVSRPAATPRRAGI